MKADMQFFNQEIIKTLKTDLKELDEITSYGFVNTGKQIRPVLTLSLSRALAGQSEETFF